MPGAESDFLKKKRENFCFSKAEKYQTGISIHQLNSRNHFLITHFPGNGNVNTKKKRDDLKKRLKSISCGRIIMKNWLIHQSLVHHIFQMHIKMEIKSLFITKKSETNGAI